MMRFIQYAVDGSLSIKEQGVPSYSPTQVLVKVNAFGVNRADLLQKQGKYPPPKGASPILGLEIAGEVQAVGNQVKGWKHGNRVCAMLSGGGYSEYVSVDADALIPTPDILSDIQAASIPEVFLTAYQALHLIGQLQSEQKVLVHAGASGVGLAAIQLAKLTKAKVAVTCSSEAKIKRCQEFGADLGINYANQDFYQELKLQWNGVDLVIDMVAGAYTNKNLKLLNMDSKIVDLAILGGRFVESFDTALLLGKRATLIGSTLRNRSEQYKAELTKAFVENCLSKFENGELNTFVDTSFDVADIEIAHARMEKNDSMGKFVITW